MLQKLQDFIDKNPKRALKWVTIVFLVASAFNIANAMEVSQLERDCKIADLKFENEYMQDQINQHSKILEKLTKKQKKEVVDE